MHYFQTFCASATLRQLPFIVKELSSIGVLQLGQRITVPRSALVISDQDRQWGQSRARDAGFRENRPGVFDQQ
jgi:hypothetical protein